MASTSTRGKKDPVWNETFLLSLNNCDLTSAAPLLELKVYTLHRYACLSSHLHIGHVQLFLLLLIVYLETCSLLIAHIQDECFGSATVSLSDLAQVQHKCQIISIIFFYYYLKNQT